MCAVCFDLTPFFRQLCLLQGLAPGPQGPAPTVNLPTRSAQPARRRICWVWPRASRCSSRLGGRRRQACVWRGFLAAQHDPQTDRRGLLCFVQNVQVPSTLLWNAVEPAVCAANGPRTGQPAGGAEADLRLVLPWIHRHEVSTALFMSGKALLLTLFFYQSIASHWYDQLANAEQRAVRAWIRVIFVLSARLWVEQHAMSFMLCL